MAINISKRPLAILDLEESGAFIGRDSLAAELRFYDSARKTFELIAEMPHLGHKRDELAHEHLQGIRSIPIRGYENWLIFYRPTSQGIDVIRVLHGARDLKFLLEGST